MFLLGIICRKPFCKNYVFSDARSVFFKGLQHHTGFAGSGRISATKMQTGLGKLMYAYLLCKRKAYICHTSVLAQTRLVWSVCLSMKTEHGRMIGNKTLKTDSKKGCRLLSVMKAKKLLLHFSAQLLNWKKKIHIRVIWLKCSESETTEKFSV